MITTIELEDGNRADSPLEILNAFVSFYQELLGSSPCPPETVRPEIIAQDPILSSEQASSMISDFSLQKIKAVFLSIDDQKSPDLDGFTTCFFQEKLGYYKS